MTDDLSIAAALERLDAWLAQDGQSILKSLRPPAADADLDELRRAIEPYEVPLEVLVLLQWHNGQVPYPQPPSLLAIDDGGPMLGTHEAAEAYGWLTSELEPWQWCPLWLPLLRHRWTQLGVEIADGGPGVVIENSFGDSGAHVISGSLAAFLHATADIAEAGFLTDLPYHETKKLIAARADQAGWDNWPHERFLVDDLEAKNWPERWRTAQNFDANSA